MHSVLCGNVGSLPDGAGGHGEAGLLGQPHHCCWSLYHCIVTGDLSCPTCLVTTHLQWSRGITSLMARVTQPDHCSLVISSLI